MSNPPEPTNTPQTPSEPTPEPKTEESPKWATDLITEMRGFRTDLQSLRLPSPDQPKADGNQSKDTPNPQPGQSSDEKPDDSPQPLAVEKPKQPKKETPAPETPPPPTPQPRWGLRKHTRSKRT